MKVRLMSAPEVAFLLRKELGPIRAWDDCLADMRRDKVAVNGYMLKPVCRALDGRPMYRTSEIVEFIVAVRAANPAAQRNASPQVKTAILDPTDRRSWRLRKLLVAAVSFTVGAPSPAVTVGP